MNRADWRDVAEGTLYDYAAIADRKDLVAVVDLLGDARIRFPSARAEGREAVSALYSRLWTGPHPHRHVVTNIRVHPDSATGTCTASAIYTRWSLEPNPVTTTLGGYELQLAEEHDGVRIVALTVTRLWPLDV